MTEVAIILVLTSAFLHAIWNTIAKYTRGGLAFVWLLSFFESLVLSPIMLLRMRDTDLNLSPDIILFMLGSACLHIAYFWLLSRGYQVGDLSIVYPLSRGFAPVMSTALAIILLAERPSLVTIGATLLISFGVFLLTGDPRRLRQSSALKGIIFALLTAVSIALYTIWDSYAVSRLLIAPIMFEWGANLFRVMILSPAMVRQWHDLKLTWQVDKYKAFVISMLSAISYILALAALTFSPVSFVAPLRSISILLGVLMGARLFKEGDTRKRLIATGAMVIGAIILGVA